MLSNCRQTIRETWANISEFNYGMFRKLHSHVNGLYTDVDKTRLENYMSYLHMNRNVSTNLQNLQNFFR